MIILLFYFVAGYPQRKISKEKSLRFLKKQPSSAPDSFDNDSPPLVIRIHH